MGNFDIVEYFGNDFDILLDDKIVLGNYYGNYFVRGNYYDNLGNDMNLDIPEMKFVVDGY